MKHRLRKRDRVAIAGKSNNKAQYVRSRPKMKWVLKKLRQGGF